MKGLTPTRPLRTTQSTAVGVSGWSGADGRAQISPALGLNSFLPA